MVPALELGHRNQIPLLPFKFLRHIEVRGTGSQRRHEEQIFTKGLTSLVITSFESIRMILM